MSNYVGSLQSLLMLDISNYVASLQKAGTVTQSEADKMGRMLKGISAQLEDLAKRGKDAANLADGISKAGENAQKTAGHMAGLNREVLVLMHEASQDNWKRFGGSLLVFGEYASTLGIGAIAARVGVVGLAGAAIGLVAEIAKGAVEQDKFNRMLQLSGNYAGVTAGKVDALSKSIAASTNGTIGASRDAVEGVATSGRFGPGQISAVAQAVASISKVTGQTTEEVVKDFARMADGVTAWAEEHNKSMHFMSAAQYDYVRQLEQQGQTERAEGVVLDALNEHLKSATQNLGLLAQGWLNVKQNASAFVYWLDGIGKGKSIDEQIVEAEHRMAELHGKTPFKNSSLLESLNGALGEDVYLNGLIKGQEELLNGLWATKKADDDAADAKARNDKIQADGASSRKRVLDLVEQGRAADALKVSLTRLYDDFDKAAKAGTPFTEQQKQDAIQEETRKHTPPETRKLDNEVQAFIKSMNDEAVKLQAEAVYYDKYGRAIDSARSAVAKFRLEQGDLKGASPAQRSAAYEAAKGDDAAKAAVEDAAAAAAIRQKVKALIDEAAARATSAREAFIAQELADKDVKSLNMENKARRELVQNLKDAAGQKFDRSVADPALAAFGTKGADTVAKIELETQAIGRNALAMKKAAEDARIYAEAMALVQKFPERATEIWQEAGRQMATVHDALDKADAKARSPATGVQTALQSYYDEATNGAKHMQDAISGALKSSEDAFVQWAMTGKLNVNSLLSYMAEQFLRSEFQSATAALINLGGGASAFSLGTLFSGFGGFFGHATGLDYVPYDGYPAWLHEGEGVLTKQENASRASGNAGGAIDASVHINSVGEGVSRAQMMATIQQANAMQSAHLRRLQQQGITS